jgi:hypothetical protein
VTSLPPSIDDDRLGGQSAWGRVTMPTSTDKIEPARISRPSVSATMSEVLGESALLSWISWQSYVQQSQS